MPGFEPLLFGHSSTGSITLQHAQEQAKKLITEAFSILKRIDTPATCQLRHAKQVMKMLSVSSNGSIPLQLQFQQIAREEIKTFSILKRIDTPATGFVRFSQ